MKRFLCLFITFACTPGFAKSVSISLQDVREIEKYVVYCKPVGQTPEKGMVQLEEYFRLKKDINTEPITCGISSFEGREPMLTVVTTGNKVDGSHQEISELNILFKKNANKNSKTKYVVNKIIESKFKWECHDYIGDQPPCGYGLSGAEDIWPVVNNSKQKKTDSGKQ